MVKFAIHLHQIGMKRDKVLDNSQAIPIMLKLQQKKPTGGGRIVGKGLLARLWVVSPILPQQAAGSLQVVN
jgi:hypothetical protein